MMYVPFQVMTNTVWQLLFSGCCKVCWQNWKVDKSCFDGIISSWHCLSVKFSKHQKKVEVENLRQNEWCTFLFKEWPTSCDSCHFEVAAKFAGMIKSRLWSMHSFSTRRDSVFLPFYVHLVNFKNRCLQEVSCETEISFVSLDCSSGMIATQEPVSFSSFRNSENLSLTSTIKLLLLVGLIFGPIKKILATEKVEVEN